VECAGMEKKEITGTDPDTHNSSALGPVKKSTIK
jgi:hypothetical protein